MKGFIEVTQDGDFGDTILVHYTHIYFITFKTGTKIAVHNNKGLKESYEEIKQLIINAQK